MIKHISIDLWMTLIRSHPEFKLKRAELIAEMFGIHNINAKVIESFVKSVDKVFDRHNEISGKKISAETMYCKVIHKIVSKDITLDDAAKLREKVDILFDEYRPVFLNPEIPFILKQLKADGYTLNLSSNTGFIEGCTLRKTLTDLRIIEYFDFLVFSDEIDASKPSQRFFEEVYSRLNIEKNEVLHIGDNPKSDYQGAKSFGFHALLITDNKYTINDIRRKLQG